MRYEETFRSIRRGRSIAPFSIAVLLFVACGEAGESAEEAKTSGLPGDVKLISLSEEKREVFCAWYDSVAPSEEACPRALQGEASPTCLEKFEQFGACTVEEVERCFASVAASSCDLPDTETCEAFRACQEEAAPANDCPDQGFDCKGVGIIEGWKGDGPRWGTCWSWWPPGCFRCHGKDPSEDEAIAWCEKEHPAICGGGHCKPAWIGMRLPPI